jgi:hypothetical protein
VKKSQSDPDIDYMTMLEKEIWELRAEIMGLRRELEDLREKVFATRR